MTSPRISIVIPDYGYGRFFSRLASDPEGQALGLVEVGSIPVDDGSTDHSRREIFPAL